MGARAIRAIEVVQLGLAISFLPFVASILISGTHNGTSSAILNAEELSIVKTPFAASFCAHSCIKCSVKKCLIEYFFIVIV